MKFLEIQGYTLSIFLPIATFFVFGLAIAWWRFGRHSKHANAADTFNERLIKELRSLRKEERISIKELLGSQVSSDPEPK